MIKFTRPPGPKQLLDPAEEVGLERTEVAKFYQTISDAKTAYKFKIYRQAYVKDAIEKIFLKKCAYCETRYAVSEPVEVEHFRPKAAVKVGKQKKRGYYWLASEWSNLLPSCIRCNRSHGYLMPNNKEVTMGKANFFPLEDETKRASAPGDESNEQPLLLNPCSDDPAEHLEFTEDGAVKPIVDSKGTVSVKGEMSIKIYALCRPELVEERARHAKSILAQIESVKDALLNVQEYPNNPRHQVALDRQLAVLEEFLKPDRPYLALARQLTTKFLKSIQK